MLRKSSSPRSRSCPPSRPAPKFPNDLAAFWLPFTPNRAFKKRPRLISRAKDMHYFTPEGRSILDATAALWCCNAGHNREPIVRAIQEQAAELDFSPTFQFAHPEGVRAGGAAGGAGAGRSRPCVLLQFRLARPPTPR